MLQCTALKTTFGRLDPGYCRDHLQSSICTLIDAGLPTIALRQQQSLTRRRPCKASVFVDVSIVVLMQQRHVWYAWHGHMDATEKCDKRQAECGDEEGCKSRTWVKVVAHAKDEVWLQLPCLNIHCASYKALVVLSQAAPVTNLCNARAWLLSSPAVLP